MNVVSSKRSSMEGGEAVPVSVEDAENVSSAGETNESAWRHVSSDGVENLLSEDGCEKAEVSKKVRSMCFMNGRNGVRLDTLVCR